jgi:hypothetical protein
MTRLKRWIGVHLLGLAPRAFEPPPPAFTPAPIDTPCESCKTLFGTLDDLGRAQQTAADAEHFLLAVGAWWIHNYLRANRNDIFQLMGTVSSLLSSSGTPTVLVRGGPAPLVDDGDRDQTKH